MDDERREIIEDLSGPLDGEILGDELTVAMYATDASLYRIVPSAVAFPRHTDDVLTLARYSEEKHVPLIARGAGSGVAGQSLGAGILVDFSRHMRRIEAIDEQTVRVQPGVVCDELNRSLRPHGRYFPPDPSGSAVNTIGGMLAVDAAGSRSVRVGSTRDHVQQIDVVLTGGHLVSFNSEPLEQLRQSGAEQGRAPIGPRKDDASSAEQIKRTILSKLSKLLLDNEHLIEQYRPALLRNCSGYSLRHIRTPTHLNVARMLVGSEGTLGLFTSATLHTAPLPKFRGIVLLLFSRLESAIEAVQAITALQPSACDLLDRRVLSLGREADSRFSRIVSPSAEAALIVEQTGYSERQARDRIGMVLDRLGDRGSDAVIGHEAYSFDDVEWLWSLARAVVPLLARLKGETRALPIVEDIAVPPEELQPFLVTAMRVFQKHDVTASLYAHAAAGQLHLRPFLPTPTPQDAGQLESLARELYEVVFAFGGTISGEHGDGLARTAFIRSQYGALYRVFQQIKDLFDPHNLMNPGKIISDDPHLTIRHLRTQAAAEPNIAELQLQWSGAEFHAAAGQCNGCASCRTQSPELRMCPFFRNEPSESTSPRSKANIVLGLTSGDVPAARLPSDAMQMLTETCFNCKQCRLECPSNVDIPGLMMEARAQQVAAGGLSRREWFLSRIDSFVGAASFAAPLANWALGNRFTRRLIEALTGIDRHRKLPVLHQRPFLKSAARAFVQSPSEIASRRPVVYFVDHYANFHDPQLARAFAAIVQHNDLPLHVPAGQTVSGMTMVSAGDLKAARAVAERNIRELAELAREGSTIVCTEPSAALCLKEEYPRLLDHPDVQVVADHTLEAGQWLAELHRDGKLRTDFRPIELEIRYHTPCHLKALTPDSPLYALLRLIPGLHLHKIEDGCCGMAGTFGLSAARFRTSLEIGQGLVQQMQSENLDAGLTECSSCKMQMEQQTDVPTLHPIKLLALAYGLMPEIERKLTTRTKKLIVS